MGFDIKENEKILIVAPHPDDETLGCAGLMLTYGRQCDVLLLTDGRGGKSEIRKNYSDEEITATRKAELRESLDMAKVKTLHCLDIPDAALSKARKQVMKFDASGYDYIFVPNKYETHPDHRAANKFFRAMRFWGKTKAKIYEYEVWTPLRITDVWIDISSFAEQKEKMISRYESQRECMDYMRLGMGLTYYRGARYNTNAAEAFYRSPASVTDKIERVVRNTLYYMPEARANKIKRILFKIMR